MRIISGQARGKKLESVPGMDTRPTTDRVKESIFNILQTFPRSKRVLDLFAGTGQMGVEALSRGAASAVFVDREEAAVRVIRRNLAGTPFEHRAAVVKGDFLEFLGKQEKNSFDLIFLDPPYGGNLLNQALKTVEKFDILSSDGIIMCEYALHDAVACPASYQLHREYRYGKIRVALIRNEAL
jgi:16S rRNA (guanine966-N2)-methyltransferase